MAITPKVYERQAELGGLPNYQQRSFNPSAEALADFGQGLARAGAGAQGALGAFAKMQGEQDEAMAKDSYRKLIDLKQTLVDGADGFLMRKRGKDAVVGSRDFFARWDSEVSKLGESMNERERRAFGAVATRVTEDVRNSVNRHVVNQDAVFKKEAHEGMLSSAFNEAVLAAENAAPHRQYVDMQKHMELALHGIELKGRSDGLDTAAIDRMQRDYRTTTYLAVIDGMLDSGKASEAQELFSRARKDMDAAVLTKAGVVKNIENAKVGEVGLAAAQEAFDKAGGNLIAAEKLLDTSDTLLAEVDVVDEARAEAKTQLRALVAKKEAAERSADSETMGKIRQLFAPGSGVRVTMKHPLVRKLMLEDTKGDLAMMIRADNNSRSGDAAARRQQAARNKYFESLYGGLDPSKKQGMDVDEFAHEFMSRFGEVEPYVIERVRKANNDDRKTFEKDEGMASGDFEKLVKERTQGMDKERADLHTRRLNAWWARQMKRKDAKGIPLVPSSDEIDAELDRSFLTEKTPGPLGLPIFQGEQTVAEREASQEKDIRENLPTAQELRDNPARMVDLQRAVAVDAGKVRLKPKKGGKPSKWMDRAQAEAWLLGENTKTGTPRSDEWEITQ